MADEIAVSIQNVSKKFKLFKNPGDRLKEALSPFGRTYHTEFWALNDINLEIPKGTTLGILGRNGAGKSTLLHMVTGVQQPTMGSIRVEGKISCLELGAGFNPEFTGRENLMIHGRIMGHSKKEVLDRIPAIEAFAEIGDFIDQPIKTYSTGMYMRLAFAAAIDMDPDILIIDEALSVGDAKFQRKCYQKFKDFQNAGKTILFVSHSSDAIVNHCNTAILLDGGRLLMHDLPSEVANEYRSLLLGRTQSVTPSTDIDAHCTVNDTVDPIENFRISAPAADQCGGRNSYNKNEKRMGQGGAEIVDYLILTENEVDPDEIKQGGKVRLFIKVRYDREVEGPTIGCKIKTTEGITVYGSSSFLQKQSLETAQAGELKTYDMQFLMSLRAGDYFLSLGVGDKKDGTPEIMDHRSDFIHFRIRGGEYWFDGIADLNMQVKNFR